MRFLIDQHSLVVDLEGHEVMLAMIGKIEINKADIVRVEYHEEFADWRPLELRMPGTGIPGVIAAGSFLTDRGWDFLYLTDMKNIFSQVTRNVLVVETKVKRYRRIIVTCGREAVSHVLEWAEL